MSKFHWSLTPGALRRLRKQHNLSQADMAAMLGWGQTAISDWENGEKPIPQLVQWVLGTAPVWHLLLRQYLENLEDGE